MFEGFDGAVHDDLGCKQEMEALQNAMKATTDALTVAFTEQYHGTAGCNYDAFYNACYDRQTATQQQGLQQLQQQQQAALQQQHAQMTAQFEAQVQARVQAQIAAMQNQGGSSGSNDASMTDA